MAHSRGFLRDPLSRFTIHLLAETLRPHLPTCKFPDFLRLPSSKNLSLEHYVNPHIPIPFGWHFVYFPSLLLEQELFSDGYDPVKSCVQLQGRSRRRWRGGKIIFGQKPLLTEMPGRCILNANLTEKVGKDSWRVDEETTRHMSNAVGEEPAEDAVIETRSLVYLPIDNESKMFSKRKGPSRIHQSTFETRLTPSRILLFRFSALTFNAHKIHYDMNYARTAENLPDIILQGALSLVLLLTWIQFDSAIVQNLGINNSSKLRSVRYSCLCNIVVDREIKLAIRPLRDGSSSWRMWIEQDGITCLKGVFDLSYL
ncbi:uncharacterized protein V1516DRAFT_675699 [Lipomyces oligophaga]|uniref:uncharacterized protein n=1 Tax=Lipomyces oligophaga TaxID=45792 RepID=UPI0034CE9DEC